MANGDSNGTCTTSVPSGALFSKQIIISTDGIQPESVACGDFNGDGEVDLAFATWGRHTGHGGQIGWVKNTKDWVKDSDEQRPLIVVAQVYAGKQIISGDFNGDGRLDMAAASYGSLHGRKDYKITWYNNTDGFGNFSEITVSTISSIKSIDYSEFLFD